MKGSRVLLGLQVYLASTDSREALHYQQDGDANCDRDGSHIPLTVAKDNETK